MYDRNADPNARTRDNLPTRDFSVALDFAGIGRHAAARAIARALAGKVRKADAGVYCVDTASGTWAVTPFPGDTDEASTRGGTIVTPPTRLAGIGGHTAAHTALAAAGATWDSACGMAVTVRAPGFTVAHLASLLTLETRSAPLIADILGDRSRWVSSAPESLAAELRRAARAGEGFDAPAVVAAVAALPAAGSIGFLGASRELVTYRALRATVDPVEYAAAVHVALGLVARAVTVEARPGTGWCRFGEGAKWAAVQFWYIMHGLVGPEFAATRALFRARVRAHHPVDHSDRRPLDTWGANPSA